MKGSKGTIASNAYQALSPLHGRGGSDRNGAEEPALDHAEGVRRCIRGTTGRPPEEFAHSWFELRGK